MDWSVILIPFISGGVGWLTNSLAVLMLFYPKNFVGIPPIFGWQGVIPRFTPKAASILATTFATKMIRVDDLVDKIANEGNTYFLQVDASKLDLVVDQIADEQMAQLWRGLGPAARQTAVDEIIVLLTPKFPDLHDSLKRHAAAMIDIENLLYTELSKDSDVLVRVIRNMATPEIRMIRNSGLYFGIPFGIVQMIAWLLMPSWWLLPAAGFLVGYFTNWAAILMILEPKKPQKVGPITFHGLFHKRRPEISAAMATDFSNLLANPAALVAHIFHGPGSAAAGEFVAESVEHLEASLENHPLRQMVSDSWIAGIDAAVLAKVVLSYIENNADAIETRLVERLGIEEMIIDNLRDMDDDQFEFFLRSVFKQEEWILLLIGGIIGLVVGWGQYTWMFAS